MYDIFTQTRKVIRWFNPEPKLTPADLEGMTIHELFEVCNSDPKHVAVAEFPQHAEPDWQIEAEALAAEDADWYATRESDRPR